jgi:hypothetical protein
MAAVRFAPGEVGSGFLFSGRGNDYVRLPANLFPFPTVGTANQPFTFEVWFSTTSGGVIIGQQDVVPFGNRLGGYEPALYVGTNGLLYAEMFYGNGLQIISTNTVNDGIFHHAAVTYDGATEILYLDGAPIGSTPLRQQSYAFSYQYQFGTGFTGGWYGAPGGWFPFAGVVDEPALYNRALTAGEVAAIFQAGSAGKCIAMASQSLRHRFSFNEPAGSTVASDSAGYADGKLLFASNTEPFTNGLPDGSGFTGSGELSLKGTNGYLSLPSEIISSLSSATFEMWVTWNGPNSSTYQRIFDFGASDHGANESGAGTNYLMLSPVRGDTNVLGFEATGVNPVDGGGVDPNAVKLLAEKPLTVGQPSYIAVTYDPIDGLSQLFVNGTLVAGTNRVLNSLSRLTDVNNWLGRSQWQPDPFFNGQFDEFRVWEGVLTPDRITTHFTAGPNQPLPVTPPEVTVTPAGENLLVSWREDISSGFQLQTKPDITANDWLTISNGIVLNKAVYHITVPPGTTKGFYRLKR